MVRIAALLRLGEAKSEIPTGGFANPKVLFEAFPIKPLCTSSHLSDATRSMFNLNLDQYLILFCNMWGIIFVPWDARCLSYATAYQDITLVPFHLRCLGLAYAGGVKPTGCIAVYADSLVALRGLQGVGSLSIFLLSGVVKSLQGWRSSCTKWTATRFLTCSISQNPSGGF